MLDWLSQNYGTLIVLAIVAIAVGAVIFRMIKNRKKGGSSCGCSCSSCSACSKCGSEKKK